LCNRSYFFSGMEENLILFRTSTLVSLLQPWSCSLPINSRLDVSLSLVKVCLDILRSHFTCASWHPSYKKMLGRRWYFIHLESLLWPESRAAPMCHWIFSLTVEHRFFRSSWPLVAVTLRCRTFPDFIIINICHSSPSRAAVIRRLVCVPFTTWSRASFWGLIFTSHGEGTMERHLQRINVSQVQTLPNSQVNISYSRGDLLLKTWWPTPIQNL